MNQAIKSDTTTTAVTLIADRQSEIGITDEQLALAVGFDQASIVTMIKSGKVKLPVDKIAAFAAALTLDPAHLLRIYLLETSPATLAAVEALLSQVLLTSNERQLIENYRYLAKGRDATPVIMDGTNIVALLSI
jgi:hypothetical protein